MALSREAILQTEDRQLHKVEVPEWGGDVFVRPMSGMERAEFETVMLNGGATVSGTKLATLIAFTTCDEAGKLLFNEEDIDRLAEKNSVPLMRIFRASSKLNALSDADVEELKGNS